MRCFIALELPQVVRAALARTVDEVRSGASAPDVRWVAEDAMHLTLRFLGEVSEARLPDVTAGLATVAARHAPIPCRVAGLGTFPGPGRPRVVWAGLADGADAAGALARDLEHAVVGLGFPAESRPFRAHVTLGRVKSPRGTSGLRAALVAAADVSAGAWTAADVVLFRSHLHPRGTRYEALSRAPLGDDAMLRSKASRTLEPPETPE